MDLTVPNNPGRRVSNWKGAALPLRTCREDSMEYEDFEVRVRSGRKDGYEVEAVPIPSLARVVDRFEPPYQPEEVEALLRSIEAELESPVRRDSIGIEEVGRRLFESLFHGKVAAALEKSLDHLAAKGRGLRLRLAFEGDDPKLIALRALPWELLLRVEHHDFLTRQRIFALARFVELNRFFPPPEVDSTLRVLVVSSAPSTEKPLDLGAELEAIRDSLDAPSFEVEVLEHPGILDLRPALLRKKWHVLHFMGHGRFEEREGQGYVVFENKDGSSDRVTATNLAENLKGLEALRLVVLNSCSGGAWPRREGQDPFSSIAPALLRAGVPAVVATQFRISDDSAIEFSKAFYQRLAAGDAVETAVAEGRLAIYNSEPDSCEWVTPVLFLATREGGILDFGDPHPPAPSPGTGEGETYSPPRPLRLGIRSFAGPGSLAMSMDKETDRMLALDEFFEGRSIRAEELWRTEVFPRVQAFLMNAASERGPVEMTLAAHASIAFAAGYCLGTKSSLDVSIRQGGRAREQLWHGESLSLPEEPLWREERSRPGDPDATDTALAVSISRDVLADVKAYQKNSGLTVRRILTASLLSGPGSEGVRDGAHALQLAQSLAWKIQSRAPEERNGVLHLFASAPNGLLFFLGQLCRGLGRIQLYEHDFDSPKAGAYQPSILLPWSAG